MGINGLLPLLKSIHKSCSLKKFEGKTLGVDAYGWLHRGTVACAMELAMGRPTRKFVDFAMHRVRMLQHFGVIPFLIFDGDYLPSKAATEADRSKRRDDSKRAGMELLNAGKTSQAYLEFQKAVDVTPEMARQLIDELKKTGVQYIVAPYEADAQMVYLERKGKIQGILSEDSDLLVFGAKCLLTKLDQYGNCIEINKSDFCAVREISLTGWSDTEFRRMAILSGCDYLASINNMGLKTSYRMVRKYKTIEKILRMLQFDGKFFVPKGYLEAYYQAELTFLHQRVFCPDARRLVLHTEPEVPIEEDKMPFIGAYVESEVAQGVARGDLNPITKQPIVLNGESNLVTSTNPWIPARPQLQRPSTIDEAMKGKPIDTFFKPKRTPLAELDINCFTPSPSQQDALRRNSGPWTASPLARPYSRRTTTELEQHVQSTPLRARNLSERPIRNSTVSEPRPVKRARLCEDNDVIDTPSLKSELGRSRFFSSDLPGQSSRRSSGIKRTKKQDITIFSDDSVEDAMLSIPDIGGKISIFEEVTNTDTRKESSGETDSQSQDSARSIHVLESQISIPSLTASTSITSSAEQPPTPTDSPTVSKRIKHLDEKFSFTSQGSSTPILTKPSNALHTPILVTSRPSRIPLAVKTNTASKTAAFSTKTNLTPLQRLGAKAGYQSKSPMAPPMTPTLSAINRSPRRSLLSKNNIPFPEVATQPRKKRVEPAFVPLPQPDEIENKALIAENGSEDLIIHDSEEECLSPCTEKLHPSVPKINLGRFVYAG